ncbi:bacteriophage N4 receptor, outer membrane subunit [Escherichia coli]|nr:hypothetical protein [Escherichia coli]EIG3127682.1 hypothetical protein [Escherichia coli]EIG6959767.1 hypothetical protein [Escherichia coli]EIH3492406.1 hypothetical protein [Escherichia coli]EIR8647082.1 hypothetical protein [Escherichia coli]EKD3798697.1 hypothetical protein [Escherichia coli]
MKENNLNRVIGWSGLLLTSLLSTSALADNIGTSTEELGLSDYRHFEPPRKSWRLNSLRKR